MGRSRSWDEVLFGELAQNSSGESWIAKTAEVVARSGA